MEMSPAACGGLQSGAESVHRRRAPDAGVTGDPPGSNCRCRVITIFARGLKLILGLGSMLGPEALPSPGAIAPPIRGHHQLGLHHGKGATQTESWASAKGEIGKAVPVV